VVFLLLLPLVAAAVTVSIAGDDAQVVFPLLLLPPAVVGVAVVVLIAGDVVRRVYAVKAGVVVEGGKPMCDDGRVDIGVHVTEMFAQVRFIFCLIFIFDLY
jgi:hypothetical protein